VYLLSSRAVSPAKATVSLTSIVIHSSLFVLRNSDDEATFDVADVVGVCPSSSTCHAINQQNRGQHRGRWL